MNVRKATGLWTLILTSMIVCSSACGRLITPQPIVVEPTADKTTPTVQSTPVATVTPRATSTPRPATPSATPSPTVTSTPIIHTIQSGDTLLSIAIEYDVDVETIQTANGIIDPRRLQIGQVLVVPDPNDEVGNPTPTTTPYPVDVRGVSFRRTGHGTLWAFGEVTNPTEQILSELVVEVSLYDADGNLLSAQAVFAQLDLLLPGHSVPFSVLFEDPPTNFGQYQVITLSAVPVIGESRYYVDLDIIEAEGIQTDDATYQISGQLENSGDHSAEAIRLVATLYDKNDQVLGQRVAELGVNVLRSQARTPFDIIIIVPDGDVDRFTIQAEGLRVP